MLGAGLAVAAFPSKAEDRVQVPDTDGKPSSPSPAACAPLAAPALSLSDLVVGPGGVLTLPERLGASRSHMASSLDKLAL
jgi:hypothetical protein